MISKKSSISRRPTQPLPERGYTLQALIIIAILVLSATVAFTVIYAILRDSTNNVVGGSETFDGLPSGPQNLEITASISTSDAADITVSWDAPSFLGENALLGYSPTVQVAGAGAGEAPTSCSYNLDVAETMPAMPIYDEPSFSRSNTCSWDSYSFTDGTDYELNFTINLSDIGGVSFTQRLPLSTQQRPQNIQTFATENAIVVSWESVGEDVAYRFHIDSNGDDSYTPGEYVLCVQPTPNTVHTQEIPNIANRPSVVWESGPETWPDALEEHNIMLAVASSSITNQASCTNDNNFPDDATDTFMGQFGTPAVPEFSVSSVDMTDSTQPLVTISSPPCDDGSIDGSTSFTFVWAEVGLPETVQETSFDSCTEVLPVVVPGGSTRSYSIRGRASNEVGDSQFSPTVIWVATTNPETPAPPQNIGAIWSGPTSLTISWEPPELEANAAINGYSLELGTVDDDTGECLLPDTSTGRTVASETRSYTYEDVDFTSLEFGTCIAVASLANGQASSPVTIAIPQPPSGQINIGSTEISVSWQANNLSEISHYVVTLRVAAQCPGSEVIFRWTVIPDFDEAATILTETFPLLAADSYVCVTAIYRDGSSQVVFASDMAVAVRPPVENLSLVNYDPDPVDPNNPELLMLTGTFTDIRYLDFFVCVDVLLPSEMWGIAADFSFSANSGNPNFTYNAGNSGQFTYAPLHLGAPGNSQMDIMAAAGETYEVRLWTSSDDTCPYPDADLAQQLTATVMLPPMMTP